MGLIPQIKCTRCDRKYSALHTRCPFCGARRRRKGQRSVTNDNSTWKMVVGLLLLVVLIAAVVVLVVTSVSENKNLDDTTQDTTNDETSQITSDEGVNSIDSSIVVTPDDTEPEEPDEPEEPVASTPSVESVVITYNGSAFSKSNYNSELGMYEFTMKATESLKLGARVTPDDTGLTPSWSVSDESVAIILQTGEITAVGKGTAIITVTVGEVSAEVMVRVRG